RRADRLVRPERGAPVGLEELLEYALGLGARISDHHSADDGRALDLPMVAPDGAAVLLEDRFLPADGLDAAADVAGVRVPRDQLERDLLTAAADEDRQARLHGRRQVPDGLGLIASARGGGRLAAEHAADHGQRLAEPAQ